MSSFNYFFLSKKNFFLILTFFQLPWAKNWKKTKLFHLFLINFFLQNNRKSTKYMLSAYANVNILPPAVIYNNWKNAGCLFQNFQFWNISLLVFQSKTLPLELIPVSWFLNHSILSIFKFYRWMFLCAKTNFNNLYLFFKTCAVNPYTTIFVVPDLSNMYWLNFFFKKKFFFFIGLGVPETNPLLIDFLLPVYYLSPLAQWFFFYYLLFNMQIGQFLLFTKKYNLITTYFSYYQLFNK